MEKANSSLKELDLSSSKPAGVLHTNPPIRLGNTRIGKGSASQVYHAWDNSNNQYAVKVYPHSPKTAECLKAEKELIARHSDFCPKVIGLYQQENKMYFVLELYNCGTLRHQMEDGVHFPESMLRELVKFLAGVLIKLENEGSFHGNLLPDRFLVHSMSNSVSFKLTVLHVPRRTAAIAAPDTEPRSINTQSRIQAEPWGLLYVAPEGATSIKSDVWSLGIILFEMAFGKRPSMLPSDFSKARQAGQPLDFPTDITPPLRNFLERCLAYEPRARFCPKELLTHPFTREVDSITSFPTLAKQPSPQSASPGSLIADLQSILSKQGMESKLKLTAKSSLAPYNILDSAGGDIYSSSHRCEHLGRHCLLKILDTSAYDNLESREFLIEEITRREEFKNFPLMIKLLDYFIYDDKLHLVLEDYPTSLEDYIQQLNTRRLPLSTNDMMIILKSVVNSIKMLHDRGHAQAILDPRNLRVEQNKEGALVGVKLPDFATPHLRSDHFATMQDVEYLPPETIVQTLFYNDRAASSVMRVTPAGDAWILGVLIHYLLTTKLPFSSSAELMTSITAKTFIVPPAPKENQTLVRLRDECLKMDPEARPSFKQIEEQEILFNGLGKTKGREIRDVATKLLKTSTDGFGKVYYYQRGDQEFALQKVNVMLRYPRQDPELKSLNIRLLLQLREVPHIVQLHDYYHEDDLRCALLSFANGGNLEDYVTTRYRGGNPLLSNEQELVVYYVVTVLKHLHTQNPKIVHGNIQPRHILVCVDAHNRNNIQDVLVTDFNSARTLDSNDVAQASGRGVRSVELAAAQPRLETLQSPIDEKSDIWFLGTLIFFLLYSRKMEVPSARNSKANEIPQIRFPDLPPTASEKLKLIMRLCLTQDPTRRPTAEKLMRFKREKK